METLVFMSKNQLFKAGKDLVHDKGHAKFVTLTNIPLVFTELSCFDVLVAPEWMCSSCTFFCIFLPSFKICVSYRLFFNMGVVNPDYPLEGIVKKHLHRLVVKQDLLSLLGAVFLAMDFVEA